MFERFDDRARRVLTLAQEEAGRLQHNYIGTEHLLLGLVADGEGVAARALEPLRISLDAARTQVQKMTGRGRATPAGYLPLTPRAKKALEVAAQESYRLGDGHVGTGHLLLALIDDQEGGGAQALQALGADLEETRQRVIRIRSEAEGTDPDS